MSGDGRGPAHGPVYLGLGSNLGDRLANLRAGVEALGDHGIAVEAASSVWETGAVEGAAGQPEFLNACVRTATGLGPAGLLAACKRIELDLGRDPGAPRHGPRPLDLDVLLIGELVSDQGPPPHVPHPGLAERRFVLLGLVELDPSLVLPGGLSARDALDRLDPEAQPARRAGLLIAG